MILGKNIEERVSIIWELHYHTFYTYTYNWRLHIIFTSVFIDLIDVLISPSIFNMQIYLIRQNEV